MMQIGKIWSLMTRPGAGPHCGQHTAIAARVPQAVKVREDMSAAVADDAAVWFCFECGHEEWQAH